MEGSIHRPGLRHAAPGYTSNMTDCLPDRSRRSHKSAAVCAPGTKHPGKPSPVNPLVSLSGPLSGEVPGEQPGTFLNREAPDQAPGARPDGTGLGLVCQRIPIDRRLSPLSRATADAFAWRSPTCEMVGFGVAARVQIAAGPDALMRTARAASRLLAAISDDAAPFGDGAVSTDESTRPGPFVVGALPFSPDSATDLIVPELTIWDDGTKAYAITVTPRRINRVMSAHEPDAVELPPAQEIVPWPQGHVTVPTSMDHQAWADLVCQAVDAMRAQDSGGQLRKVVLARQIHLDDETPFPATTLLQRLAAHSHAPYIYSCEGMVGASPELLVRRNGDEVVSEPTGGTIARHADRRRDEAQAAALLASVKDQVEHRYVADAVADGLAEVAKVERVAVRVVRFPTVAHLVTTVHGQLALPAPSALELVARLSPTPAVAGVPRDEALRHIREHEPFDRGQYGGPVGWMDRAGDGEWAIALRGAHVRGTRVTITAGAGIVEASDPQAEWRETEAKLQAVLALIDQPLDSSR